MKKGRGLIGRRVSVRKPAYSRWRGTWIMAGVGAYSYLLRRPTSPDEMIAVSKTNVRFLRGHYGVKK